MGKEIITLGNIKIEKQNFHGCKDSISINDVNIDRIVVSNKFSFGKKGFKYFIGYENDNEKLCPYVLCFQKRVHIKEILMKLNICLF